jgi:hypothetical protein
MKNTNNINNNFLTIILCNGCSVSPDLLDFIRFVVLERISELPSQMALTIREICGEENWDMLTPMNRIEAGWCMVHLVEKGEVPFIKVEGKHEYPCLYELIPYHRAMCFSS